MNAENNVQLIGHTGAEIQIHRFDNNGCVGRLSLCTNLKYKTQQGDKVEVAEWHNLVFRNKGAEIIEEYVKKGDQLSIVGRLTYRNYENDKGEKVFITEIVVSDFKMLSKKA